ncbi:diaminopimelate epimerase [Pelotomaculum isophthalicicum JI]|uniref:Diaminopimelate epimerase n=1 Tax=Pelotomaculum isophthalicicum JI TaxID=947010 RepID=A0A9X4H4Y5_9FIRM|nr:diaminopimelate epimerase [Pelotomaculum isophthalicicum]MDF9408027.1 diaminopimelate epimerase [Pelotomaculum isophthalicicum JI]
MRFTKVQGLGNDFILADYIEEKFIPDDFPGIAVKACDRHFGIGADGLVPLLTSEVADIKMRIFNSDGSEAEMCGNVIRCAAKYLFEHGIVRKNKIKVETLAGIMIPELIIENERVSMIRVDMGEPRLQRSEIPMEGPPGKVVNEPLEAGGIIYNVTAVSMGNPHCVIFVPDVEQIPLQTAGPLLEKHHLFPCKTNVEFVQVDNQDEVYMRVWERGAGETMACGTGACAAAVASAINGYTRRQLSVRLKAGVLFIEWAANNHIYMTGPAEEVFTGDYPIFNY